VQTILFGEQMAMARVFYHKPKFTILDGVWMFMVSLFRAVPDDL